ncbi:hypothetical protein EW027_10740 [Aeribacillus pallidus]|nr:hypothetical protein EW027_10740 [Aeribacillus pallidus]
MSGIDALIILFANWTQNR